MLLFVSLKKWGKISFLVVLVVVFSFLSSSMAEIKRVSEFKLKDVLDLKIPRYIFADSNGNIYLLYGTESDELVVSDVWGKKKVVMNAKHKGHSSVPVAALLNNKLYMSWREKTDFKELFFRTLDLKRFKPGKIVKVDDKTQPLARTKIAAFPSGRVELIWYGEEPGKGKDGKVRSIYSIYGAASWNGGKSFESAVILTGGYRWAIYPVLLKGDKSVYMFTEAVNPGDKHKLVFRKKSGKKWGPLRVIGDIGTVSLYMRSLRIGKRIMIFWFNTYDGVPLVEMAYSDDDGSTWHRIKFEDTKGLDLTGMQVATNGKDKVYMVISGMWQKEEDKAESKFQVKDNVYFFYSHDRGTSWSKMLPLRHYPYKLTRAHLPNIVCHDDTVVVVWNDYRNIRGNIYMNFSKDGGVNWQKNDISLEEPGRFNSRLHWNANNIVYVNGTYYVLIHRFQSDALAKANPVVIKFRIP